MGRRIIYHAEIGKEYNWLTVLGPRVEVAPHRFKIPCRCRCGKEVLMRPEHLVTLKRKSCGCYRFARPKMWTCRVCRRELPYTSEFFHIGQGRIHGLKYDCKECDRAAARSYQRRLRLEALTAYGGVTPACVCCGESIIDFLTFDHPNNDGHIERKTHKTVHQFLLALKRQGWPAGRVQIMCYNCNLGRAHAPDHRCPHEQQRKKSP